MLINEILNELHVRPAVSRRQLLGMTQRLQKILTPIANRLILYRSFYQEIPSAITYVSNHGRDLSAVNSTDTVRTTQVDLLNQLGITNPAFAYSEPHTNTSSANIIVPPANSKVFWNPNIHDLGSAQLSNGSYAKTKEELLAVANTYQQGWPTERVGVELIIDCPGYYLIDIKKLIPLASSMYHQDRGGKHLMFSYDDSKSPNEKEWYKHLNTYGDILKFVHNLTN